jgi:hypothetical protein
MIRIRVRLADDGRSVIPRIPDMPSSDATFTYPSSLTRPLLRRDCKSRLSSSTAQGVRLIASRCVNRSIIDFRADRHSPVDASNALCPLGSSPTIEARLMDVISASCLTPDYFFVLRIKLHKADWAIAFNRFPLAGRISSFGFFRFNRSFLKYLAKLLPEISSQYPSTGVQP